MKGNTHTFWAHISRVGQCLLGRCFWDFLGSVTFSQRVFSQKNVCVASQEMSKMIHIHPRSTEFLASYCWNNSILAFKLRPKHHYCWHVAVHVRMSQINPKIHHCWSEENFLGQIKKNAAKCHGATVQKRSIERYVVALSSYMAKMPC